MSLFDLFRFAKSLVGLVTGKSKLTPKSDTGCLVVGMENSRKYGSCPGSAHDAQEMGKLLKKYGSITVLRDGGASRAAVKSSLQAAVQKDLAIFHYSGHGGKSGGSEYLCLNDGPMWDREIWDIVSKAKGRVVLIFDCCHSGHMYRDAQVPDVDWPGVIHSDVEPLNKGFEFSMLSSVAMSMGEGRGILVWSGCPKESYSYGDENGGVFTNGILLGCSSLVATYDSVWRRARRNAHGQRPVRTVIGTGFKGLVFR